MVQRVYARPAAAHSPSRATKAGLDILDMLYIYSNGPMTSARASRLLIAPISAAGGTLYEQIVDSLKREISEGRLEPGAPLPSFRKLAKELLVSVITVKRAYEEL